MSLCGVLTIRPWAMDDLDDFTDLYTRWEVMRWLGTQPRRVLTEDEARTRLERWSQQTMDEPWGIWAVEPTDDPERAGRAVGTVLLVPLDPPAEGQEQSVEVGWHLHPDVQGRGYATQAANAVIPRAWDQGLTEVLAVTDQDNLASQAVMRRLGMRDEGTSDRWYGQVLRVFRLISPRCA